MKPAKTIIARGRGIWIYPFSKKRTSILPPVAAVSFGTGHVRPATKIDYENQWKAIYGNPIEIVALSHHDLMPGVYYRNFKTIQL